VRSKHKRTASPAAKVKNPSGPPSAGSLAVLPPTQPPRSAVRLWSFRLFALALVPLIVLGAAELVLRLSGFGYPTAFFKPMRIERAEFLVENDNFGLRFFPAAVARSPAPTVMSPTKAEGVIRIFVFGESAALGDPRPAFGAPRYLQTLLRERYPGRKFEVICVAMTAINSHVLVEIARECKQYQGDFWIVYMGNNEMVGPYGAATVFGAQAPPRFLVRLGLAAQRLRVGQALARLAEKVRPHSQKTWGGMEMFLHSRVAPDSKNKNVVYDSFKRNLDEIIEDGISCGARVLVSSVAVNLKDCPPFASISRRNLPAADQATLDQLIAQSSGAAAASNFTQAAKLLEQASHLDPTSAILHYHCAEHFTAAGDLPAAKHQFQAACDDDALPFRADSKINAIIAQGAARSGPPKGKLAYFDAPSWFEQLSHGEPPGLQWFYEHVHFNFDGNYQLALGWAQALEPWLAIGASAPGASSWPSQEICERRLALTDWNRVGVLEDVLLRLDRAPFAGQEDNANRIAACQAVIAQLRKRRDTNASQQARSLYRDAISLDETDPLLHENFAEFLEDAGDPDAAIVQWQRVASLLPQHHLGYYHSGRLLSERRKFAEARSWLAKSVTLRPDLEDGWVELGKLDYAEGHYQLAIDDLQKARALLPMDYRIYYQQGRALTKLSRGPEAIQNYRKVIELRPTYWQAHYSLGEDLAFSGQNQEAIEQFREVLRQHPQHVLSHLNLGVALYKAGHRDEAVQYFHETLRLDPQNKSAADYLKHLESMPPPQ
jgi:tetratricopeptide (TPR) repeat protein